MRTEYRGVTALLRPLISYLERINERADDEARAAALSVERVGRWLRCYRDPRKNSSCRQRRGRPHRWEGGMNTALRCLDCAALLYTDPATGGLVDQWGERTCSASYRPYAADLSEPTVRAARPATPSTPGRLARADRSDPVPTGGGRG
jgi:hypothetical protein